MPELSNGEQKRLFDNLTIPAKFFTNKILKRGKNEKKSVETKGQKHLQTQFFDRKSIEYERRIGFSTVA